LMTMAVRTNAPASGCGASRSSLKLIYDGAGG
jgi:hypothetical protein